MANISRTLLRVIVSAPRRGKLALTWEYDDATCETEPATVAAVHRALAQSGESISVEALSRIAFCGARMVLTRRPEAAARAQADAGGWAPRLP
jgi:hypothetical protein